MRIQTEYPNITNTVVHLSDPSGTLEIYGEITVHLGKHVEVNGISHQLSLDNYMEIRPRELIGKFFDSSIWVGGIYSFEPAVHGSRDQFGKVRVRATEYFVGDFHPRQMDVTEVSVLLEGLPPLSPFNDYEQTISSDRCTINRAYQIVPHEVELYSCESLRVFIQQRSRIGKSIHYEQYLAVQNEAGSSSSRLGMTLQLSSTLISLITQSDLRLSPFLFCDMQFRQSTANIISRCSRERSREHEWLVNQAELVPLLRDALPEWISNCIRCDAHVYSLQFLHALYDDLTIESSFLTLCQCFEALSRDRIGSTRFDSELFRLEVVEQLEPVISKLNGDCVNSNLRGALRSSIKSVNNITLRQRITSVFDRLPGFSRLVNKNLPNMRFLIESRRNNLSHGNSVGALRNQQDADSMFLETDVIRGLCLAELLFVCGFSDEKTDALVLSDKAMRTFEWSCEAIQDRCRRQAGMQNRYDP